MIQIDIKARLACDEEGCSQTTPVSLVLLPTGGLGASFPPTIAKLGWQCTVDRDNPTRPFLGRCPTHAKAAPRIVAPFAQ